MTQEEFCKSVCVKSKRNHKVLNSLGLNQIYKKGRFDIEYKLYSKIIKYINGLIARNLQNGIEFTMPYRLGKIILAKREAKAEFKEGKLVNSYPIDWKKTMELWYNDKQSRDSKTLVKNTNPVVYRILYSKKGAVFTNKVSYAFQINRQIKRGLVDNIKNNKIDTYLL